MRGGWLAVLLLFLLPAAAGCLDARGQEEPPPGGGGGGGGGTGGPPLGFAVVADISPGVNPYHQLFQRNWTHAPWEVIPGLTQDNVTLLNLTLGDAYAASRNADNGTWDNYTQEVLYWVPGTNLLMLTLRPWEFLPDGNENTFHGTASTDAVNLACPECYVLVVQDRLSLDGVPVRHIAQELPWVDFVVSTNIPGPYNPLFGQHDEATRELWETGRLYVSFAGNTPVVGLINPEAPYPIHYVDLPPWVVLVGGAHSECSATELRAGKPPEFVGNFTQRLARPETVDATWIVSGTSFSAPQVAGMLGRALFDVRQALGPGEKPRAALWEGPTGPGPYLQDGNLTQEEVRHALAASARYFAPTEFSTACPGFSYATPMPASPTPWIEMGWGYAGPQEADLAAAVLLGTVPIPEKPADAEAWMDAYMQARAVAYPW